ncbi:MAG: carboxypeptidase-like regulatory domain-containing protein, partial [Bacteroidetes bacterium]|nr:carboxypeptidase-like regulatory domain-containing protein [Bacteroidota bacterium]
MNLHNFLLFTAFMLLSSTVFSQKQITGKVIDSNDPLEGVSIYFEGTTIGTTSDVNGEFSIQKPENSSTLIFSYLGFIDQKVEITTQDVVDITMVPDSESLDEIVVIGYGSQIKNDITGAVSVVNVEEIAKTYSANLTDQLQGRVAGVTVNTSGKPGTIGDIKIRGASFFGGNNPLYVIDGILTGDNPTLNPADIASLQVLKDAS